VPPYEAYGVFTRSSKLPANVFKIHVLMLDVWFRMDFAFIFLTLYCLVVENYGEP